MNFFSLLFFSSAIIFSTCSIHSIQAQPNRNSPSGSPLDAAISEMSKKVEMKLCEPNDFNDDVMKRIEQCREIDPYNKIERLFKECENIRFTSPVTSWNEQRRMRCKMHECYESAMKKPEHNNGWDEVRKISEQQYNAIIKKKYECLQKVLRV